MAKIFPHIDANKNLKSVGPHPDTKLFAQLIGEEFLDYIFENVPQKVGSRIGKALDHFDKAIKLKEVDE